MFVSLRQGLGYTALLELIEFSCLTLPSAGPAGMCHLHAGLIYTLVLPLRRPYPKNSFGKLLPSKVNPCGCGDSV